MKQHADPAEIAHLLRRTSFGASPGSVQELAAVGWDNALTIVVDQATAPRVPPVITFKNQYLKSEDEDYQKLLDTEVDRLADVEAGLGDRMLWFWHGLITSAISKVELPALMFRQHQLLAKHALGNFGKMLIDITTDVAMVIYLDLDGSVGSDPNENYARELMELFSLGRGHYQQADVKAAARGLAGWYVKNFPETEGQSFDPDRIDAAFDPSSAYTAPVTYLGKTAVLDVPSIVQTILEQDACARFVAAKLFQYFIHPSPDDDSIAMLAGVFRRANYEIRPLLSALFRHPDFRGPKARGSRARQPIEVMLAAAIAFGIPATAFDYGTYLYATGQLPFDPPNVAGWPLGNRWLAASHALSRERLGLSAFGLNAKRQPVKAISRADNPVDEALMSAGLYEVSTGTRAQLTRAANAISDPKDRARALLALAVASPEFALV